MTTMKRLKLNKHFLHILKYARPKLRKAILENADDELIKTLLEIVVNTLNGNHKVTKSIKSKLSKYKHCFRKLACTKVPLKKKRKIIVQTGGFLSILLPSLLSGLIGKLIN